MYSTKTWKMPTLKSFQMYQRVRSHGSKHVPFLHPNQCETERTCRFAKLLRRKGYVDGRESRYIAQGQVLKVVPK